MIPLKWMNKLYQLKKDNDIILQFYGDPDQCTPVDIRYFDYMKKKTFREMCDNNLMIKEYLEGCGRYNKALYGVLSYFKKHQKLPVCLKKKHLVLRDDISIVCKTNDVRWKVIDSITKRTKQKKVQKYFYKGLKVISNLSNKIIHRSKFYYIAGIQNNKVSLSDKKNGKPILNKKKEIVWILIEKRKPERGSKYNIDPACCVTCYKYQGDTIKTEYNILEINNKMTFNEAYTSLSRGISLDMIHFSYTNKVFEKAKERWFPTSVELIKPKRGEIYEMSNNKVQKYYVGYTTTSTEKRFEEHKEFQKDPIHKHGKMKDWSPRKIENVYYFAEEEIRKIESFYIADYFDKGFELINTQKMPKKQIKYDIKAPAFDDSVREKFHISVSDGKVRMSYKERGKRKAKAIRFGTSKTQEEAMNEMLAVKQQLLYH